MIPRASVLLALVITSICASVSAFVPLQSHPGLSLQNLHRILLLGSKTDDVDLTDQTNEEKATLTFSVTVDMSSDTLPDGTKAADVAAFLDNKENRASLLSAGGKRAVEEVAMTPEMENLWKEACQRDYGDEMLPGPGDCILAVATNIQFPGLKMTNKIYNGAKLSSNEASGMPKHTFLLIGEQLTVSGLPPVVWIFNKLTGAEKKKGSKKPSGVGVSQITAVEDSDCNLVFSFLADIKIKIKFPAVLLKILPTNKEKAEKSGSASVKKSVDKDVAIGVKGIYDIFLKSQSR